MSLKNIRFQKTDDYNNSIFIATSDEKANYKLLSSYSQKLINKDFDTFLPIYHNDEYKFTTIRFAEDSKFKPKEHCIYDVNFTIRVKNKDGKKFVNCYIDKLKFISKTPRDFGEILVL